MAVKHDTRVQDWIETNGAAAIPVDSSGFSGTLSASDNTVQKALDTIDSSESNMYAIAMSVSMGRF